ncbi:hypothetical protein [Streptomyces cavernicola]|uniref:DUF4192 domain-containing protein n=1 Tax=Streptomyces cavernicola TaxID=3043613 RepID=A0ABT6SAE7_9ACTN|nr:hypothetical protein [Streptomyces sp. B-S-A6]MDI3405166.1 hypothetical protein [Streptomyces sp. B-S-A6]
MAITGEDTAPGTALLLAAAPVGRGALVDAAGVLPALAAVPPSTLTGTPAATVVELADPADPQTVLTRIRAAAAAPGPLTVLLAGQLHLDGKQHRLHLALARTTPATLRYTALPWHWLETELAVRRPGTTTLVVDLVATPEAWRRLHTDRSPDAGTHGIHVRGTRLYGRIAPPPPRRRLAQPTYLKALTALWRSGSRAPLGHLHEQVVNQGEFGDALLLAVEGDTALMARPTPPPQAPPAPRYPESAPRIPEPGGEDPLPAILAAAHAGRHSEAAALAAVGEGRALRTHGAGSAQAVHWLEVRADLARLDGDPARSCALWMAAADARLARQEAPDSAVVEAAVDRAHHQWQQVVEPVRARELGALLVALRRHVPGRRAGAADAVEHRMHLLHTDRPTAATDPTNADRTTAT